MFLSYYQILLLHPHVVQRDPLEIAKRLAWWWDDSPVSGTNSEARCCNCYNAVRHRSGASSRSNRRVAFITLAGSGHSLEERVSY